MAGEVKQSATGTPFAGNEEEKFGEPLGGAILSLDSGLAVFVIASKGGPAPLKEFMPNSGEHKELGDIRRLEVFTGEHKNNFLHILIFNRDLKRDPDPQYLKYAAQFLITKTPYQELKVFVEDISPWLQGPETFLKEEPEVS